MGRLITVLSKKYKYSNGETRNLINAMTTKPTQTRVTLIDNVITRLKTADVWSKLDVLYVFAAASSQAALLQWKQTGANATTVNNPTFTPDRGYVSNGTTSYLRTNYNPASFGGTYSQNSASVGTWLLTNAQSSGFDTGAANTKLCVRDTSDKFKGRLNDSTDDSSVALTTESRGSTCFSRSASTGYVVYKDGVVVETITRTSAAIDNTNLFALCRSNGGTPANFSTRQMAALWYGASLSAGEVQALHSALSAYLTGVGAV